MLNVIFPSIVQYRIIIHAMCTNSIIKNHKNQKIVK